MHVHRRDKRAGQAAPHGNTAVREPLEDLAEDQVGLQQRRTAQAVDQADHLIARAKGKSLHDAGKHAGDHVPRRLGLLTGNAALTVDTHADFHLAVG